VGYLTQADAFAQRGGLDNHIYQGDLFQSHDFMVPLAVGDWDEKLWDLIVISHDCEYTKIAEKPSRPLLVAPVRKLSDYQQRDAILAGKNYSIWALPREESVDDDEYVVDFRLIQPIAVGRLQGLTRWTSLDDELRLELAARIELFLFRGRLG
jgi:hypothetical protein